MKPHRYPIGVVLYRDGNGGFWLPAELTSVRRMTVRVHNSIQSHWQSYIQDHPIFSGIQTTDVVPNQWYVKIPLFYSIHGIFTDGPLAGSPYYFIHHRRMKGLSSHKAFQYRSGLQKEILIGAYPAVLDEATGLLVSRPGDPPTLTPSEVRAKTPAYQPDAGERPVRPMTIYDLAALQILRLIETMGEYGESGAYRGITALNGPRWQWVDGVQTYQNVWRLAETNGVLASDPDDFEAGLIDTQVQSPLAQHPIGQTEMATWMRFPDNALLANYGVTLPSNTEELPTASSYRFDAFCMPGAVEGGRPDHLGLVFGGHAATWVARPEGYGLFAYYTHRLDAPAWPRLAV